MLKIGLGFLAFSAFFFLNLRPGKVGHLAVNLLLHDRNNDHDPKFSLDHEVCMRIPHY